MRSCLSIKDLSHWLALWRAPQMQPPIFMALTDHYPDLTGLFDDAKRGTLPFQATDTLLTYLKNPDLKGVDRDLTWLGKAQNRSILTLIDPEYPKILKSIADPPPLLFVEGDAQCLSSPQIAIVGSRQASVDGCETAQRFAHALTKRGLCITSGLAWGIDAWAHRGALMAGRTVAVMGTGPDRIYPQKNQRLANEIAAHGALVSAFPCGVPPMPYNFPRRNRIVSGLSLGVLVVEASIKSGSLITARLAGEQGREVFAIPNTLRNPLAQGCHRLIQQGAKLVENIADILEELPRSFQPTAPPADHQKKPQRKKILDSSHKKLLECVGFQATTIDTIMGRSDVPIHIVSAGLTQLELQGWIRETAIGYIRVK